MRWCVIGLSNSLTHSFGPAAKAAIAGPLDPKQRQARLALFREICYTFQQSYWEIEVSGNPRQV